jgi:acetyltransferase-like isoleucine patch superfamily enzyme
MRAFLNRLRRRVARALLFRMVFGEPGLPHTRIAPSTCIEGEAGLRLGDHVFIGQFNFIDATAGLSIGEGVQITNFVSIVTHSSHRSIRLLGRQYATRQGAAPGFVKGPVSIGAYSFIGPHSLIEAGARIGKACVVCAYSQVRGEVPDFAIVAGQPARVIGDVRERDEALLQQHPELRAHYEELFQ